MKNKTTFFRMVAPVVAASFALAAPVVAHGDEDHEHTPLGEAMEQTSKALKSLRKIDKDDWAAAAKAARTAADGARKAMEFEPALVKEMADGTEKVKAVADYRRIMGLSYAALCELEIAYLDKDQAKVDAALKKIKSIKKDGHKKYTDD